MRIGHPCSWGSKGLGVGIDGSPPHHLHDLLFDRGRDGLVVFAQAFEVSSDSVINVLQGLSPCFALRDTAGHSATNTPSSSWSMSTRYFTSHLLSLIVAIPIA